MKYIRMNIFKATVLFSFLAVMVACNEDLGNYDYKNINIVKIRDTGNDKGLSNYTCDLGETLKIEPILEFSAGEDESLFTYTWYYRTSNGWQVLQEGRNLDIEVADPIGMPDKTYSLAYEIVNKKNQIPYRKTFLLKVNNPLTRGFLALCEHDNDFDIDQIALSSAGQFTLYKNILEMSGSELPRQGVKPYDVLAFHDPMAPDPYNKAGLEYSLYILTNQYTTRILTNDFSWKPSYDISNSIESNSYLDKEYVKKGKPIIAEKMKFAYVIHGAIISVRSMFYLNEGNGQGNWYICTVWPMWVFYSNPMNNLRPSGNARFEPAPFTYLGTSGALYYDTGQKAFMYQSFPAVVGTTDLYYTQALPNEAGGAFNFSDPNDGLLYMGEQEDNFYPSAGYAILKQAGGSYKYIEFTDQKTVANMVTTENKKRASVFPAISNIGQAKFFARSPFAKAPYLYYVTNDNKVYKADISAANAAVEDITSTVLSGGYNEITAFKYMLPNTTGIGGGAERHLAVATYNPSLGKDTGGKLEFFTIVSDVSGQLTRAKFPNNEAAKNGYQIDMSWTGLGKIVGLSYKEM
ncbi:PKD-like family lipoprotein [Dysgonomonas reticulitermitis]